MARRSRGAVNQAEAPVGVYLPTVQLVGSQARARVLPAPAGEAAAARTQRLAWMSRPFDTTPWRSIKKRIVPFTLLGLNYAFLSDGVAASGSQEPTALSSNGTIVRPIYEPVDQLRFAEDQPGAWHSQLEQDRLIFKLLRRKRGGFFVDLAANHPVYISNTRTLERDHGWSGLCIEANPRYWGLLRGVRSCKVVGVAVADSERVVQFVDQMKGGFSGLVLPGTKNDPRSVRKTNRTGNLVNLFDAVALPFGTILRNMNAPTTIDYLSLDVEGAEDYVMTSFPFESYAISLITVEAPSAQLTRRLTANGYALLCTQCPPLHHTCLGRGDDVWVHRTARPHVDAPEDEIAQCSNRPRCERLLNSAWRCGK